MKDNYSFSCRVTFLSSLCAGMCQCLDKGVARTMLLGSRMMFWFILA